MPEIVLHFTPGSEVADADELGHEAQKIEGVEAASVEAADNRADVNDIIMVLQVATTLATTGTAALLALKGLIDASGDLGKRFGLHAPRIEVGLETVPLHELTPSQLDELAKG